MAKKSKLDLSSDGLKKMAINHGEKVVFALCAVVLLLLAYFGFSRKTFDDSKVTPVALIDSAEKSKKNIESVEWGDKENKDVPSFAASRIPNQGIPKKS